MGLIRDRWRAYADAQLLTRASELGLGGGGVSLEDLTAAVALLQDRATASTDAELTAAVDTLTTALNSKQDGSTAATDAELLAATATLQDAATAATDAELAAAVSTLNAAIAGASSPFTTGLSGAAIVPVDLTDSWVVGSDRMDRDTAASTKDGRAFFNKAKNAFRAGISTGSSWDDANLGTSSAAFGSNTRASGSASHAEGLNTIANGANTHAEGDATTATGAASHAEGNTTLATGGASHAEGFGTRAQATAAHAEGDTTTASGSYSHAEGSSTTASGGASHAEGELCTASGSHSHAQGQRSLASRRGQDAMANGQFGTNGDAQTSRMVLRALTTNATSTAVTSDAGAVTLTGADTNVLTIPASKAYLVKIDLVARRADGATHEAAAWTWEGLVSRGSTGNAVLTSQPARQTWSQNSDFWSALFAVNSSDATNNYLAINVVGEAGKTIRWVASVSWTEAG